MSRSYSPSLTKKFPPLLRRLVRAAEVECPPGHAEALTEFISIALRNDTPRRLARSKAPLAIQSIAMAQFEVDEAIVAWRRAVTMANVSPAARERSVAHNRPPIPGGSDLSRRSVCAKAEDPPLRESVGDRRAPDNADFYAGLVMGLVFAGPSATSS